MNPELLNEKQVAPSILSADFGRLGEQVEMVMSAGARVIHVDVMDGHFVPPITIGPLIVAALRDQVHEAGGILDVHLMIERPEEQIDQFANAGADAISIHSEARSRLNDALKQIRSVGCAAGLAINPATPLDVVDQVVDELDYVVCMSVNPGWAGQAFIPGSLPRLNQLRERLPASVALEVDGGISASTVTDCVGAGANLLVAGSAVFGAGDPAVAYRDLVQAA